jgi:hypothetical protein
MTGNKVLAALAGTSWTGEHELWLDPLGNSAHGGGCTLTIEPKALRYTWEHEGKTYRGLFELEQPIRWSDTFHEPAAVACRPLPDAWGLLAVSYTYPAPPGPDWGWRIGLSRRPDDTLVLQMTNVTPWGEEGRAVRMVFARRT